MGGVRVRCQVVTVSFLHDEDGTSAQVQVQRFPDQTVYAGETPDPDDLPPDIRDALRRWVK